MCQPGLKVHVSRKYQGELGVPCLTRSLDKLKVPTFWVWVALASCWVVLLSCSSTFGQIKYLHTSYWFLAFCWNDGRTDLAPVLSLGFKHCPHPQILTTTKTVFQIVATIGGRVQGLGLNTDEVQGKPTQRGFRVEGLPQRKRFAFHNASMERCPTGAVKAPMPMSRDGFSIPLPKGAKGQLKEGLISNKGL